MKKAAPVKGGVGWNSREIGWTGRGLAASECGFLCATHYIQRMGHMIRATIAAVVVGLTLAGCQVKRVSEMSFTELKAARQAVKQRCISQGVKEGSAEWQPCLNQEAAREVAVRDRVAAAQDADTGPVVCNTIGYTTICN
jgi:hypothetical protein